MANSFLPFDPSKYEQRQVNSFVYEPLLDANGDLEDFRVVYASDFFTKQWQAVCDNKNYIGVRLKKSGLMDDFSLQMMEQFYTNPPYAFVTYNSMINRHLLFEPIMGLPEPYAGFYLTDVTGFASWKTQEHFLQNVQMMKNNVVLLRKLPNGHFDPIFVSEEYAKMMECNVDEARNMLSGTGFYKTTNPEDRPLVRSMLKHHMDYKGNNFLTIRKRTAKKNTVWCNIHYAFIDDFNEHYIYCTYTDVTALKQYEERLRNVYAAMGNSFYQMNDKTLAMFRVNLTKDIIEEIKGRDLYSTDSTAYSYTESMRRRSRYYAIPSEQALFLQMFDRNRLSEVYLSGTTAVSQVIYTIRPNGRVCFVNLSASVTRHPLTGDVIAFITEREYNTEKVQAVLSSKILAQQFDMVSYLADGEYGVTIGDATRIKKGNIFPTTRNGNYLEYLNSQVYPVLMGTEEDKKAVINALSLETISAQLAVKEPYVVNIGIEISGEIYYKQFDFYSIDPNAKFYILLKRDTSEIQKEQIERNKQLSEALEAANQANVAKTAFLSNMSHEIRTPMNAIIGLDNIALKDPDLSEQTRERLEKIGSSAKHLLSLINDILDMSRIESGRMTIKSEEFSFREMLEQINTMILGQCQDKGLTYDCQTIGHIDDYYIGDDMKLKQVIINILGNAVKFTPSPGTVSFIVECTAEFDGKSTLRFIMKDTGIGMDKSYIPKIFEAFSQEDSSKANKYGSTGLGMAITKNIVELMNGNIDVESEKGVGSTFTVNVTLRNSERKSDDTSHFNLGDLKVLIIDDNSISCEHAKIVLEEIGVPADTCTNGQDALEAIRLKQARREEYNLILVDWKMPGESGIEITQEIRKMISPDCVVIVLTAYDWTDIEEEAAAAGVDSFMAKPLFASNVLTVFRQALENKRSAQKQQAQVDLDGRRILLAEDMLINAEIMIEILTMMEMQVEHAENGQIAVDMFTAHPEHYYDAILMDMRMPVMDGLTATKTIRASDKGDSKTIPIIALTANAFDEDVQRSLQAGMNAHLSKPVEPDQLFSTLASLIRD